MTRRPASAAPILDALLIRWIARRCKCGTCGTRHAPLRRHGVVYLDCPKCDRERERLEIRNNELEFENQWANGEVI